MTTMSKKSAVADTERGVNEPAFAMGNGRAVADAGDSAPPAGQPAAVRWSHAVPGPVTARRSSLVVRRLF